MAKKGVWEPFVELRKRNKVLFTIVVAFAIILFWKGAWNLADVLFDEWLFGGHVFWSNLAAAIVGLAILSASGLVLDRLA